MFALEADTVEYGEWKTGQRTEGATYAHLLLHPQDHPVHRRRARRLGPGHRRLPLGDGRDPNPVQPESAIIAIKATIGLLPAVAALIAMLIFIKYPLTDARFREIRDETEARKREQENLVLPEGGLDS